MAPHRRPNARSRATGSQKTVPAPVPLPRIGKSMGRLEGTGISFSAEAAGRRVGGHRAPDDGRAVHFATLNARDLLWPLKEHERPLSSFRKRRKIFLLYLPRSVRRLFATYQISPNTNTMFSKTTASSGPRLRESIHPEKNAVPKSTDIRMRATINRLKSILSSRNPRTPAEVSIHRPSKGHKPFALSASTQVCEYQHFRLGSNRCLDSNQQQASRVH
jgi:hypothetical protein